jgi:hypothetical protein
MRILSIIGFALLALAGAPAAAQPSNQAVARGDAVTRGEIGRILAADNVDIRGFSPRQVATMIRAIPRGRAPSDFWTAYQAHVRAWEATAAATERMERLANAKPILQADAAADLAEANDGIESTFAEVERIARSYGVDMPVPPGTPLPTT